MCNFLNGINYNFICNRTVDKIRRALIKKATHGMASFSLLDFFVFSVYMSGQLISTYPYIKQLLIALKFSMLLCIFLVYSSRVINERQEFSAHVVCPFVIALSIIVSSSSVQSLLLAIQRYYSAIAIVLYIDIRSRHIQRLMNSAFFSAFFKVLVNAIAIAAFPDGVFFSKSAGAPYWVIGQKQEFVNVFLLAFSFGLILWKNRGHRPAIVLCFALMAYSIFILNSKPWGLIICLFLVVSGILFEKASRIRMNAAFLFAVNIAGEVAILLICANFKKILLLKGLFDSLQSVSSANGFTKYDSLVARFNIWKDAMFVI